MGSPAGPVLPSPYSYPAGITCLYGGGTGFYSAESWVSVLFYRGCLGAAYQRLLCLTGPKSLGCPWLSSHLVCVLTKDKGPAVMVVRKESGPKSIV